MKRSIASCLLLLLLCGCEPTISATVTRFNALPPEPPHQTFAVLAQGLQIGNLEFRHAAELVAAALQAQGYRVVAPEDKLKADLVVFLQYGPAGSRTQVVEYGPPRYWRWGYPPFDVDTLYSQFLEVDLADGAAWRQGQQRMVFQGRAFVESYAREINVVLPYLVQAVFQGFPGPNGETTRVTVPLSGA